MYTHTLSGSSLHYVKRPGAILHPGMLVARIDLDDPSHVRQAEKFLGPLPSAPKLSESQKAKVHQVEPLIPLSSHCLWKSQLWTNFRFHVRVCVCVCVCVCRGSSRRI